MPWPMPDLETKLPMASGLQDYFQADWWRGYWQLPLDVESQELYTVMTNRGMYTPTRVLMGATDAVAYCQAAVEQIFGELLDDKILAWLDDVLGYATSQTELLDTLERVLQCCMQFGLKLHCIRPSVCSTSVVPSGAARSCQSTACRIVQIESVGSWK